MRSLVILKGIYYGWMDALTLIGFQPHTVRCYLRTTHSIALSPLFFFLFFPSTSMFVRSRYTTNHPIPFYQSYAL